MRHTRPLRIVAVLFAITLIGAAQAAPPSEHGGVQVIRNLEYGKPGDPAQSLDLYLPAQRAGGARPHLLVWIHGGAWSRGSKKTVGFRWLLDRGYAVASVEYRFSQQAIYPAQIHDCKGAIRWLRAHASQYGYDAARIVVGGDSAGGHLSSLLGTSAGVKELEGDVGGNLEQSSRVQGVVDCWGPSDFTTFFDQPSVFKVDDPNNPFAKLIGGLTTAHPERSRAASPVTFIDPTDPPFLILHGDRDNVVPVAQARAFAAALQKAGVPATLEVIPNATHTVKTLNDPALRDRVEKFIAQRIAAEN